ncbi:EPIDERMAL PATTERNING FACTOR-like protein 5 [Wolffia australiana]
MKRRRATPPPRPSLSFVLFFFSLLALPAMAEAGERKPLSLAAPLVARRRGPWLGLGSWPPPCSAKCARCTPCQPVHVAIPPGRSLPSDYYPETWLCQCGGRFYTP